MAGGSLLAMTTPRAELEHSLEEGLYLAVGMAVLGLQRVRASQRRLGDANLLARLWAAADALAEPITGPLREVATRAQQGRR